MAVRSIDITKNFLCFPIGRNEELINVLLSCGEQKMYDLDLRLSEKADFFTWLDVSSMRGKTLVLSFEGDSKKLQGIMQTDSLPKNGDGEKLRPRIHYTPMRGWVNDPNGLVYCGGKYHLFYQHNPYDVRWGNMHWGYAVSSDLIHWKEQGEALYPDTDGTMFSGCGVYDAQNITGLGTAENSPLLLYYTVAGGTNKVSEGKKFTICIAYSTDNGKTFVKYDKNPVLDNYVYGNRDPKVFWHNGVKKWCMVLFLYGYRFAFYSSDNLLDWKYESEDDFPTMNECPDVFEIGNTGKWAILAGADYWGNESVGKYYVGVFDGKKFEKEGGPYLIDFGKSFYSLQTFDNDPLGRRVLIGWRTRNFHLPPEQNVPFNGEFSIPTEIKPCYIDSKLCLARYPVKEFFDIPAQKEETKNYEFIDAAKKDVLLLDEELDSAVQFSISAKLEENAIIELDLGGEKIFYHSETQTLQCFRNNIVVPLEDGKLSLLIIRDTMSLEIYAQEGKYPLTGYFNALSHKAKIEVYRGKLKDVCLNYKELQNIHKN